jgi:hypothetical protein
LKSCSSRWSLYLIRENFYRLSFTPPLWFVVSILQSSRPSGHFDPVGRTDQRSIVICSSGASCWACCPVPEAKRRMSQIKTVSFGKTRIFFTFCFLFLKNIWSENLLQNYTSGVVGDGGRDLPPCPTAVGGARYLRLPTAVGHSGRGSVSFQKFEIFLFELG